MQQVFLVDDLTGQMTELDIEENILELKFQVSDISDIESRKDNVSKTINIKGTAKNNYAFGHLFLLNRQYSESISNKLFFNYNPLRKVNCLVYEDNLLVINGYMVITSVKIDQKRNIVYSANITGAVAPIKDLLGESMLTDLDLSDMKHTYTTLSILDSWGGATPLSNPNTVGNSRTYWTDPSNNTEYTKPFALGTGYVYASSIDYGEKFVFDTNNQDLKKQKVQNLRPQIYAAELLKRCLKTINYTYEVAGNPTTVEKFNRLIVPDNSTDIFTTTTGFKLAYTKQTQSYLNVQSSIVFYDSALGDPVLRYPNEKIYTAPLRFGQSTLFDNELLMWTPRKFPLQNTYNGITHTNVSMRNQILFRVLRDMKTSMKIALNVTIKNIDPAGLPQTYTLQMVKRKGSLSTTDNDSEDYSDFEVIGEKNFTVPYLGSGWPAQNSTIDMVMDDVTLYRLEEFMFRVKFNYTTNLYLTVTDGYWQMAKDSTSQFQRTIKMGDKIIPKAPSDISQFDFFKSLLLLMNLYVYSEKENPRHLILKSYDDFYAKASPLNLALTALNYTNKIDYGKGLEIKNNLNLPKKYDFRYSEDSDYLNSKYQDKHGEPFGTFNFNDSLGSASEKKIELKFAPTPPAQIDTVDRMMNFFTADEVSLIGKKKMKVKPRILYYSGVYGCADYGIYDELYQNYTVNWQPDLVTNVRFYALASMYLYRNNESIFGTPFVNGVAQKPVPIDSLMFGKPKSFFFVPNATYENLNANLFTGFYVGMISELTNANMVTFTCYANLTSFDISNFRLDTPVFIDMAENGYAYFKVISVDYGGQNAVSKLTLQKIV